MTTARSLLKIIAAEQLTPKNAESVVKRAFEKYFKIEDYDYELDDSDDTPSGTATFVATLKRPFSTKIADEEFTMDISISIDVTVVENDTPEFNAVFELNIELFDYELAQELQEDFDKSFENKSEWSDDIASMVPTINEYVQDRWGQFRVSAAKVIKQRVESLADDYQKVSTQIHNFKP